MASPNRNSGDTGARDQTDVRAGSREGVVRYVLIIGLGLAIIAMLVVYLAV